MPNNPNLELLQSELENKKRKIKKNRKNATFARQKKAMEQSNYYDNLKRKVKVIDKRKKK
jgi:hypothetical protein